MLNYIVNINKFKTKIYDYIYYLSKKYIGEIIESDENEEVEEVEEVEE